MGESFVTFPKSFGTLQFAIPKGPNFITTVNYRAGESGTPYSVSMLTDDEIDTLCAVMAAKMKEKARKR